MMAMVAGAVLIGGLNMGSMERQHMERSLLGRNLQSDSCYNNMVVNGNFEEGGGSVDGWYATDRSSTFGPVASDTGGSTLYLAYRTSITEGVRTSMAGSVGSNAYCLIGSDFYLRVQAKIKMVYQDTGEGVWTCLDPSLPYINGNFAKYNCPMFAITTHRIGEPVESRFEIHDTTMDWDPTGGWNTIDFVYQVPSSQSGSNIDDLRLDIFGGPISAAIYVDDVVITRIDELTGTENIITPTAPSCYDKLDSNGDGLYTTPLGWETFGQWFGSTSIDVVADETSSSGHSMLAYERDMPEYQGLGHYLQTGCLNTGSPAIFVEIEVMLYDEATGAGIISCDPTTDTTILNCPFLQIDLRRDMWSDARPYRFFDYVMANDWNPYDWNKISLVIQLWRKPGDNASWDLGLFNILGGPKGSVLKIGSTSMRSIEVANYPSNVPTMYWFGRLILPPWCYDNIIKNPHFEDSTNEWINTDTGNTFETVPNTEKGGNALYFAFRSSWRNGALQRMNEAVGCLAPNSDRTPFYLRIKARVKMTVQGTNKPAHGCTNDKVRARGNFARYNCPHFMVISHKVRATRNFVMEAHDVNLDWDPLAWNDVDLIYRVPRNQARTDIDDFSIQILGGPANAALYIDDFAVMRVEKQDLPADNPVWDPLSDQRCSENILQNGEGEYQSPWGWDAFGRMFGHTRIDVVVDESADTGYSMISFDRSLPEYQGIGQFLKKNCFQGYDYYVHLQAIVQLYDQSDGQGVTTCNTETVDNMLDCPFVQLDIRRQGQRFGVPYRFFDRGMINNWNPYGWNKINAILAIAPSPTGERLLSEANIDLVLFNFLGGPPNTVLKLDNTVAQRIDDYADLPGGVPILGLEGDPLVGAIKACSMIGDPHYVSFGGVQFDNHEPGWNTLYETAKLKIEVHHLIVIGEMSVADAVRINYEHDGKRLYYEFKDGAVPLIDSTLTFPDPAVRITIGTLQWRKMWPYSVYLSTYDVSGCGGLCCDGDFTQVRQNVTEMEDLLCDTAMSIKDAEAVCYKSRDTDFFEACILDVRIMSCVEDATPTDSAKLIAISTESVEVKQAAMDAAESEVHYAITGIGKEPDYGVVGDPLIMGLSGQVFKFDGRNDAWYANLASDSLQWNMKFHQFEECPEHEDLFVTELGIGFYESNYLSRLFSTQKSRTMLHSVAIRVIDENEFFPGCPSGPEVCLGDGSLEIVVDGESITSPGDYYSSANGGLRVVAYNVDGACSRKWFDFVEAEGNDLFGRPARLLSGNKPPIDYLVEDWETMVNPVACNEWAQDRVQYDDLFLQRGRWSTIHIETPLVTFHVEYRQNIASGNCLSHNVDAWMAETSSELSSETWKGILGETRRPKYYKNGEQILGDRALILSGKEDSDYEVSGTFGSDFAAMDYGSWGWLGSRG